MIVIVYEVPDAVPPEEEERASRGRGRQETHLRCEVDDLLGEPRCPLCHTPLQILMTRQGPKYHCACDEVMN